MKITKLLPLVFALALICPAFAEDVPSVKEATSQIDLTLKDYVKVTTTTPTIVKAATFDAGYTTLTVPAIQPAFNVVNNVKNQTLTLTAKTKGTSLDALYKVDGNWAIAFANTTNVPEDTSVTSLTAGDAAAVASNANVIALSIDAANNSAWTETLGGSHTTNVTGQNAVVYTLQSGTYDILYTLGTTQMANTFSTHDSSGTYRATIYLTATTGA
jgi:hypothetical protein